MKVIEQAPLKKEKQEISQSEKRNKTKKKSIRICQEKSKEKSGTDVLLSGGKPRVRKKRIAKIITIEKWFIYITYSNNEN